MYIVTRVIEHWIVRVQACRREVPRYPSPGVSTSVQETGGSISGAAKRTNPFTSGPVESAQPDRPTVKRPDTGRVD
jgi:hypothetical protein